MDAPGRSEGCLRCQVLPVLSAGSSACVSGIAVPTLTAQVFLWENQGWEILVYRSPSLHACWATGYCIATDQLMGKAVVGVSCSVHISPELLCLWQSCPPSCITKENFPDVLRLTDSSTLVFVVQSKTSWFSFFGVY